MANAYVPNNQVRLSATFSVVGVASDPTTVVCNVKDPTGTVTTYSSPVKDSVGNYHQDLTPTIPGDWFYAWTGAGAVVAATESFFKVLPVQAV